MSEQIWITAPGRIEHRRALARELGAGEARVLVDYAGVCGTDLAIWSGTYRVPLPLVPGHEWEGHVLEVRGPGDASLKGRRVTGQINNHCRALGHPAPCPACLADLESHCQRRTVTGIVGREGAFQSELIVPSALLVPLPESVSEGAGVLVEPLAAAIESFVHTPVVRGERLVVLGPGRLGLLVAFVARARGADVLLIGRNRERLAWARGQGFETLEADLGTRITTDDPLAPAASPAREAVLRWTKGLGADRIVEATGDDRGLDLALDLVRPRGRIALKTTSGSPRVGFAATRAVVDEIVIEGSRCGPFDEAVALLETAAIPTDALIESVFPLNEASAALEAARAARKVLLRPERD